ncbi:MAG TPA: hypothetical protein VGI30_02240 [Caulobacteraceae bacterium]
MFAKTFHHLLALLGLVEEPAPEPAPETTTAVWCADFGCLDLNVPDQAFDALRRVVSRQRAKESSQRVPAKFDLAA